MTEYDKILDADGNIVVRASAGTGKTYTLVNRIGNDLKKYNSYKDIAAITFTRKAANEIKNRTLGLDSRHFVGTNNSFAVNEIIIPFIRDAFGKAYIKKNDDGNYQIETDYNQKFNSYDNGKNKISNEGIIGSYGDNRRNFVFELALEIVKKSDACKKYLKSRFFRIYIDEYQDTDKTMHELFMFLGDTLKIPLFIVGDDKQCIYVWRGAYPEQFNQLIRRNDYHVYTLSINYRSCQSIQNFSNLLNKETAKYYQKTDEKNVSIVIDNANNWINILYDKLDFNKSIAILSRSNDEAEEYAKKANLMWKENDFVQIKHCPVSDITTEDGWFYEGIANYVLTDGMYSEYDFIFSSPREILNKGVKREIKKYLTTLRNLYNDKKQRRFYIDEISSLININISKENYKKLSATLDSPEYKDVLKNNLIPYKHVSMTVHASKGLEYDQVIVFAKDYPHLSNKDKEDCKRHYVAVTRAKERLFIVQAKGYETYSSFLTRTFKEYDVKIKDVCSFIE